MKALLLTFIIAQGADLATTTVGLKRGCTEYNPLYGKNPSTTTMVMAKGGSMLVIGTFAWGAHKRGNTKLAKTMLIVGAVAGGAAAGWNVTQLPNC